MQTHTLLPPIIHFVWMGGPIDPKYLQEIIKLAKVAKKSGFEFNFWCDDEKNLHGPLAKLINQDLHVSNQQLRTALGIKYRDIADLNTKMQRDLFYKEDDRLKHFNLNMLRERIGSKNLAAASDFIRYEILRQEGGYYFDTDTLFSIADDAFLLPQKAPLGIVANVRVIEDSGTPEVVGNNDIIACMPNHPVMEEAIKQTIANYDKLDKTKVMAEKERELKEAKKIVTIKKAMVNYLISIRGNSKLPASYETRVEEAETAYAAAVAAQGKAEASYYGYKQFYEKMANHHIDKNATKMDMKRYPYARHVDKRVESARFTHTLNASGPNMLNKILTAFINRHKKINPKYVAFNPYLGNVRVKANTDTTWIPKEKPKSFTGMSFDDTAIPSHFFSKPTCKKRKPKQPRHKITNSPKSNRNK